MHWENEIRVNISLYVNLPCKVAKIENSNKYLYKPINQWNIWDSESIKTYSNKICNDTFWMNSFKCTVESIFVSYCAVLPLIEWLILSFLLRPNRPQKYKQYFADVQPYVLHSHLMSDRTSWHSDLPRQCLSSNLKLVALPVMKMLRMPQHADTDVQLRTQEVSLREYREHLDTNHLL